MLSMNFVLKFSIESRYSNSSTTTSRAIWWSRHALGLSDSDAESRAEEGEGGLGREK